MNGPTQPQPTEPLRYASSGLAWSVDRHELHAQFLPVNLATEVLFGGFGLFILMGLLCIPLLLIRYAFVGQFSMAMYITTLALGLFVLLIWCIIITRAILKLIRRVQHHHQPIALHATPSGLTLICPKEWSNPLHLSGGDIRRIDAYTTGWDLSLARIAYLRIWSHDDYRVTEVRFATRERDLPDRLIQALHDALRLPQAGQRRQDTQPTASVSEHP